MNFIATRHHRSAPADSPEADEAQNRRRTENRWLLARRLERWFDRLRRPDWRRKADSFANAEERFVPRLTMLEPRIVLNATAELSAITGLSVLGDAADDFVNFNVVDNGNALQLTDINGQVIPISGHTGGATGMETDPLSISDIAGGNVAIDLGDGDDVLDLELPDGINLSVVDGAGNDRTDVDVQPNSSPSPATDIAIASDVINFDPGILVVQFADRDVQLDGAVQFGSTLANSTTHIDLGDGSLEVNGTITLLGSTRVSGGAADVVWGNAPLSASASNVDLFFDLDVNGGSNIELGEIDQAAGSFLDELRIVSATDVTFRDDLFVTGAFSIESTSQVIFEGDVTAGTIDVGAVDIDSTETIRSVTGAIVLVADDRLSITGSLDSTTPGVLGSISLGASDMMFGETSLRSDGGSILINGETQVDGTLAVDSGDGGASGVAGDVDWFGSIVSAGGIGSGRLSITAIGSAGSGEISINGGIGGVVAGDANDLGSVLITGELVSVGDVGVDGGAIVLDGSQINLSGASVRSSDVGSSGGSEVRLTGDARFTLMNASVISDGDLLLDGSHQTLGGNDSVALSAGGDVVLRGDFRGGDELRLQAAQIVQIDSTLGDWEQISIGADGGIDVLTESIESVDSVLFENVVRFAADTEIVSSTARFDSSVFVSSANVVRLDAVMLDSVAASAIDKTGAGELVLIQDNTVGSDLSVQAGTLRIDGQMLGLAEIEVFAGGTLAGSGSVAGAVVLSGGTLSPNEFVSGGRTGQLRVGSLVANSNAAYQVTVDGSVVGASLDSVAVDGDPIQLTSVELQLDVVVTLPGDTELLILQNDSVTDVQGRFFVLFDENGAPLANPRELFDGALVLNQFGNGGNAAPAYITYFGGDGNDVTIVTAGDHVETVDDVSVVSRRGVNLEIRHGASFADAVAANPTVRPIAGLNGNTLSIVPTVLAAELFVDVDGFVDPSTNPLHFDADINFLATSGGGSGNVTFSDSDLTTSDSPERLHASYQTASNLTIVFDHDDGVTPDYRVGMFGVQAIDLSLPSSFFEVDLTPLDDQLVVRADGDPEFSVLDLTEGGTDNAFRFMNPTQTLLVDGRSGDDDLSFQGFGQNLDAVPIVVGGQGQDQIRWNASIDVGAATLSHDVRLEAESIELDGDVRLASGGGIQIEAVDVLRIASRLDATTGSILIESAAAESDLSAGELVSDASTDAIAIYGGNFRLGDVIATGGTLVLGDTGSLGTIASVSQAIGSGLLVDRVASNSVGTLILDSTANEIRAIDLDAIGSMMILDSEGGLEVRARSGQSIDIQAAGDVLIESAFADSSSLRVTTSGNIFGAVGQLGLHASGANIELLTGIAFPGQIVVPGTAFDIGSPSTPIRVSATQVFSASTSGSDGSIYVDSPTLSNPVTTGDLPIGLADAGQGRVELRAGRIDDAFGSVDVDLMGDEIVLIAESGIGSLRTLTATGLSDLSAVSSSGTIRTDLLADRTIELSDVTTGGGDDSEVLIRHFGSHRLSVLDVANLDGNVEIVSNSGSIDVLENSGGDSVSAFSGGGLLIQNLNGESDITVRGSIASDDGDVSIRAQRNLVFTSSGRIASTDGQVELIAGDDSLLTLSTLAMVDGATVNAGVGAVALTAPGNIFVSSVRSNNVGDAIEITSQFGALVDAGNSDVDLIASVGTTRIDVLSGIGDGDPIETELGRLVASNRGTGAIELVENSSVVLENVVITNGKIDIIAVGPINAENVVLENVGLSESHDLRLETTDSTSDLLIGTITANDVSDVMLVSADDVLLGDVDSLLVSDDLAITSLNGSDDGSIAVRLNTNVNDLEFFVSGPNRGDAEIAEVDSIRLASSDRGDDAEAVQTGNGEIRITAQETILIADGMSIGEGADLRDDVEVIAGGDHGRIRLAGMEAIHIGDAVQFQAEQSTAEAVTMEAPEIVLGNSFQIETGSSVGVARVFAPRPDEGLRGTAFYDATTVATNRLEQAAINDATGILTVDIGNEGERGLTINIDWGAPTARFQQIDSLSGDADPLQVQHLYLEEDILSSTLNGRGSATDPLEVRFSVRHHESIVVMGQTIRQGDGATETVEGELISSTDNPLTEDGPSTPVLENGTARFIIPNLTIPVAFFPVRDVIPVLEQEAPVVDQEPVFVVIGGQFETSEAVASSTVAREEFFQIRVLSPDPEGEDLIPPERLPDDIVSGDKLRELFRSLPDGRYDIQYVLGDGNVRSILTVDLRDGKPIVPGQDLDGGAMRLIPMEDNASDGEGDQDSESEDGTKVDGDQARFNSQDDRSFTSQRHNEHTSTPEPVVRRLSVAGRLRVRGQMLTRGQIDEGAAN